MIVYKQLTKDSMYPRPGSNRHGFKGQGILSPSCLPIPPLRHLHKKSRLPSGPCGAENEIGTLWSGKRDSNSRPRPWQGRALPTELFPLCLQIGNLITFAQGFRLRIAVQKYNFFQYRKHFREKFSFFVVFSLFLRQIDKRF